MNDLGVTLKYTIRLLLHPILTVEQIIRERNSRASYYAVWLALLAMIINSVLLFQSAAGPFHRIGLSGSTIAILRFVIVFFTVPISFFVGRFFFLAFTKGGLRVLKRKTYPKDPTERMEKSNLLKLVYPYYYVPIAIEMLLLLVNYPGSGAYQATLNVLFGLYSLLIQIVSIKRIYHVSGIVAFFAPAIVVLLACVILFLIWLGTTGSIHILSNFT
ncbi:hypothetical protein LSG31_22005 [Fodinisporobacter ferrooxydans]|uniref:Yip1 domain-containing protein n=1 Tax=Fodinisporobacter ferrooxydans TaxID=2901836 RepID=A0ABY4CJ10_9BACL|nr:hypothetical protein LSG31_22005 [Alicyclobacillaceae bacterium MYW30-H2]